MESTDRWVIPTGLLVALAKARAKEKAKSTIPPTTGATKFPTMPIGIGIGTVTIGDPIGGMLAGGTMTTRGIEDMDATARVQLLRVTLATVGQAMSPTSTTATVRWRVIPTDLLVEQRF